jgi:quercetin dioxygenase-like cupin family protein
LLAIALAAGCGDDDDADGSADASSTTPVVRQVLGETQPPNAPGQQLYLQRVTIEPGAALPPHFHDGTQVAYIESGTLTYSIETGTLQVTRADGSHETIAAPAETKLAPGDWIVEPRDLVHFGGNDGDERVVIVLTALLAEDADLSTAVEE